jgi:hypothetical protein
MHDQCARNSGIPSLLNLWFSRVFTLHRRKTRAIYSLVNLGKKIRKIMLLLPFFTKVLLALSINGDSGEIQAPLCPALIKLVNSAETKKTRRSRETEGERMLVFKQEFATEGDGAPPNQKSSSHFIASESFSRTSATLCAICHFQLVGHPQNTRPLDLSLF